MARLCCCMLVISCLTMQVRLEAQLFSPSLRHVVKQGIVGVVASGIFVLGGIATANSMQIAILPAEYLEEVESNDTRALTDEEIELAWRRVRINAHRPYQSVFYLLLDGFNLGKRIMHIEFIGYSKDNEPLFVGARNYLLSGEKKNGKQELILRWTQASLVGHNNFAAHNIEIEEIKYFRHPAHESYDQTLLVIKDIDLSEYEPLRLSTHPKPETPLTMLSYRIRQENLLKIFDYPLERRACTTDFVAEADLMLMHDCHIPISPSIQASPILNAQTSDLVAIYFGVRSDGKPYATLLLPELLSYMASTLDVSSHDKMATTWGQVKGDSLFKSSKY